MNLGLRIGVPMTRAAGVSWTPALLPNLAFRSVVNDGVYTDAAGTVRATLTGDLIRYLPDPVGGNHFTSAADNVRPSLKLNPSRYKGKASLLFNGGLGQYLNNAAYAGMALAPAFTLVAFYKGSVSGSQPVLGQAGGCYLDQEGSAFYAQTNGNSSVGGSFAWNHLNAKVAILRFDGTATGNTNRLKFRGNKIDRTLNFNGTTVAATLPNLTGLYISRFPLGSTGLDGEVFEVFGVARCITDAECLLIDSYAASAYFDEGLSEVQCAGDSLTAGYPDHTADGLDWPTKLGTLLGAGWISLNQGHTTFTLAQIRSVVQGTTVVGRDEWRRRDVAIAQGGSNDFSPTTNDRTADQGIADMTGIVSDLHANGFVVGVVTVPPTGGFGNTAGQYATFEARRLNYNSRVLAGEPGNDFTVDWAADARFQEPEDSRYFNPADQVHLTAAMNDVAAYLAYPGAKGSGSAANPGTPAGVAPAVFTQPANVSVNAGSDATFESDATGGPLPTVQWQQSTNGGSTWADIGGATGEILTLSAVTVGMNSYRYRAVFTNSAGTGNSNSATLTVVVPSTTLVDDQYTGSNGTNPTSRAAVPGPGPAPTSGGGNWQIQSNKLSEADGIEGLLVYDAGQADVTQDVTFSTNPINSTGVVSRYIDANNYLLFAKTGILYKKDVGVLSQLQAGSMTMADGSVLTVVTNGNNITRKHNGTVVGSTYTLTGGDATKFDTPTKFGVRFNSDATARVSEVKVAT